jgi:hypothetical protein
MENRATLEQVEHLAAQLPPAEQLKLVAHICEQLSARSSVDQVVEDEATVQRRHEQEADEILALCDAAAETWDGEVDAAERIRWMRQERDKQICPTSRRCGVSASQANIPNKH